MLRWRSRFRSRYELDEDGHLTHGLTVPAYVLCNISFFVIFWGFTVFLAIGVCSRLLGSIFRVYGCFIHVRTGLHFWVYRLHFF